MSANLLFVDELSIISKEILQAFGGRKHEGLLSVIVDTKTNKIYVVPHTMEHVNAACELLGITKNALESNPTLAERLIPINILIRDDLIVGVMNGRSGMEMGYKVTHPKKANDKAHGLIWNLIAQSADSGGLQVGKIEFDKIFYSR